MTRPCDECIVTMMCKEVCPDYILYLKKNMMPDFEHFVKDYYEGSEITAANDVRKASFELHKYSK